jgi:hypothetical protein
MSPPVGSFPVNGKLRFTRLVMGTVFPLFYPELGTCANLAEDIPGCPLEIR